MPIATGTAILAAGALGAGASALSANKAASAQKSAAQQATNTQQGMFDQTQANLQPFIAGGTQAQNMLTQRLPELTAPINMDQSMLEQTPGYQFNLQQGLKAAQSSAAARGLGSSGAAIKGATQYATGLADSTYQNQFQNAVSNQTNAYNKLYGATSLGANAAAGLGSQAVQTGANIGQNITGAGNAQAGSYIAGGNALTSAAQSVPNAMLTNQLLKNQGAGQYGANAWQNPDQYSNLGNQLVNNTTWG